MSEASSPAIHRRQILTGGAAATVAGLVSAGVVYGQDQTSPSEKADTLVAPPEGKQILLSVKLGMIASKLNGKPVSLTDRLSMAADAGLDGVDFDQAGKRTIEEAREAVRSSGVFVHNAINHDHWKKRFTSPNEKDRQAAHDNLAHCIRLSHAAGGNGVLLVPGAGKDGTPEECAARATAGIRALIPLAASLGQPILFENVWNQMFYDHGTPAPPEQSVDGHVAFIDGFNSAWVGQYFDIGNHWKYGQPGDWIRGLGRRCVKLDVKGFSRAERKFKDIGDGDLPWDDVRAALAEINFTGWATAEVGGGDVVRLTVVREKMEKVFGL